MTHEELDLVILSAIKCSRPPCRESGSSAKTRTLYLHQGIHICMITFLFLHSISRFRLQMHYNRNGVTPRIHANTHCAPKHTASMEDTQRAVTFITNVAALHALSLPGRNRTNEDECYLLLPSDMTKAFVSMRLHVRKTMLLLLRGKSLRRYGMKYCFTL